MRMETSRRAGLTVPWLGCIDSAESDCGAYSGRERPTVRQRTDPGSAGRRPPAQPRGRDDLAEKIVMTCKSLCDSQYLTIPCEPYGNVASAPAAVQL